MKLPIPTLFLAAAATAFQAANAKETLFGGGVGGSPGHGRVRGSKVDKNPDKEPRSLGGFGPHGICTDTYPTLDLSQAYQPLNDPEQVYPDADGVTRVQMIFGLAHYKGASFDTVLRVHDGVAPGKTIHVMPGGRIELELINCLREPLGFNGPEAKNKYHIPNSTNIHTHGPHISGASPGDNIFLNIGPGDSSYYVYEFNENHMPGTFWYHPHLHGSSALQVGQGAAGMLIVDHPEDYEIPDVIMDMPEHQMVFQHLSLDLLRDSSSISDDEVTNWVDHNFNMTNVTTDLTNFMLVNMQFLPEVTMEVDKWYLWRMAMSSVRESISFLSQSGDCEFQLLAKDGIYLADAPRTVPAVILSPGNKADVAVRCSEIGLEYMNTTNLAFFPKFGGFNPETQYAQSAAQEDMEYPDVPDLVGNFHDPELQPVVMVINVIAVGGGMMPDDDLEPFTDDDLEPFTVPTPCYLVDLLDLDEDEIEIGHFINEYWCESPREQLWPVVSDPDDTCGVFGPYGEGGGFNPANQTFENLIPYSDSSTYINDFEVGSIQEIDLRGVIFHPYHQHINPFQIQEVLNPIPGFDLDTYTAEAVKIWYQVGDWQDTLQYPSFSLSDGRTRATFAKIRFQVDQFTGHMLQHCHLLFHEDQGMMAQYDMRGDEGTTWDGARDIDRTCIKPTTKKGLYNVGKDKLRLCEGDCGDDLDCAGDLVCFTREDKKSTDAVPGCAGEGKPGDDYCTVRPSDTYLLYTGGRENLGRCEGNCGNDDDCGTDNHENDLGCFKRRGLDPVPGCDGLGVKDVNYCIL